MIWSFRISSIQTSPPFDQCSANAVKLNGLQYKLWSIWVLLAKHFSNLITLDFYRFCFFQCLKFLYLRARNCELFILLSLCVYIVYHFIIGFNPVEKLNSTSCIASFHLFILFHELFNLTSKKHKSKWPFLIKIKQNKVSL